MTAEQDNLSRRLYEPVDLQGNKSQWEQDRVLRLKRLQEITGPIVGKRFNELSEEGKNFIDKNIRQLIALCNATWSQLKNSEIDPFIELSLTADGKIFEYGPPRLIMHTRETQKAANILLNALMPELGLTIQDDFDTARKKAKPLVEKKFADINPDGMISFSTVLPGIYVQFSRLSDEPKKAVSITISAFKENLGSSTNLI